MEKRKEAYKSIQRSAFGTNHTDPGKRRSKIIRTIFQLGGCGFLYKRRKPIVPSNDTTRISLSEIVCKGQKAFPAATSERQPFGPSRKRTLERIEDCLYQELDQYWLKKCYTNNSRENRIKNHINQRLPFLQNLDLWKCHFNTIR